jgi:hypothetical protein
MHPPVAVLAELDADERVELRSGLADLRGEELVMVDQLVSPNGPPVGGCAR